jgi:ubiquinone/menaquinone biosynthesis C-methylase UbiE
VSATRPEMGDFFKDPELAQRWRQAEGGIAKWTGLFGDILLSRLRPVASGRVLDLACGAGYPTIELADRLGPGVQVIGVDASEPALQAARDYAGDRPGLSFDVADVAALPYAAGRFHAVTCNLGLHLFPDPAAALRESWRVLRPGGQAVFTVPLAGTLEVFFPTYDAVVEERGLADRVPRSRRPDPDELAASFAEAGFRDVQVTADWRDFEFPEATALIERFPPLAMSRGRLPEAVRDPVWEEVVARIEGARAGGPIRTRVGIGCASAHRPA